MTTVVILDDKPARPAKPMPVASYLRDLSDVTRELSDDWLFHSVSPETKRRMLAERGLALAEAALP